MVWKTKKRNKVNIFMQFVCHSLPEKKEKFRNGWSVTYKKKVEAANRVVTKQVAFQNLANGKL